MLLGDIGCLNVLRSWVREAKRVVTAVSSRSGKNSEWVMKVRVDICLSGVAAATADSALDSARLLMALKPLHNKAKLSRLQIERLQLGFGSAAHLFRDLLCLLLGAQERLRRRLNPATLAASIGSAKSRAGKAFPRLATHRRHYEGVSRLHRHFLSLSCLVLHP
jgi:hypothetical protein